MTVGTTKGGLLNELLEILPIGIGRCVGIRVLAEMIRVSPEKALAMLRELEAKGLAVCTRGETCGRRCLWNFWYRHE